MDLRFVGRESDFLVLEDSSGERYQVLIDDDVRDAIRQSQQALQSGISPRDVQARLRAGEQLEEIATDLGVTVAAIEPFAAPILDELRFVIQAALTTPVADGDHMTPLGELMERDNPGASFSAKRDDNGWLVTASGTAEMMWKFDPRSKSLEAKNPAATDLMKSHASRDIVTSTIQVIDEPEQEQEPSASVHDLVEELRARRAAKPEQVRPATAKGRASLPSWDEIVLGTNQTSDSDAD